MTGIALVRIDDRLIHGQVVVKWLRYVECDEVLIVDDQLAQDSFMQTVLRLAAPPEVPVRVVAGGEAPGKLAAAGAGGRRTMILLKAPQTALALLNDGVAFSELNVGGLASGPRTRRLYKSVSASAEQIAALREIAARGVRVYFQMVPEDRPVEMADVLRSGALASQAAHAAHSARGVG